MDIVNHLENRLLFAVPKKGRLQSSTLSLLEGSDIQFRRETRLDIALVKNLPLALIFLPAADIPTFVGEGRVDLGITGRDQIEEWRRGAITRGGGRVKDDDHDGEGLEEVLDLGFGRCRLEVEVPELGPIQSVRDLVGRNVVTSFVGLAEDFFSELEKEMEGEKVGENGEGDLKENLPPLKTKIKYVGGSVEAACALGVADGVVDLVESGETMKAAGLKGIHTVLQSTALLIKSRRASNPSLVSLIAERIKGVINAQKYLLCQYNIPRSLLSKAAAITPGKRAPTITALDEPDWVAVSSMVKKQDLAVVMDQLTEVGATDILCLQIMNSRAG